MKFVASKPTLNEWFEKFSKEKGNNRKKKKNLKLQKGKTTGMDKYLN